MKKYVLAAAIILGLAGPALADECTDMIDRIELALPTAALDDVTRIQVLESFRQGKSEHDAGNHAAAENALRQTLNLLGQ